MSRIIVKNIPKDFPEKKLKELFGSKGRVTDVQLKYTKKGTFRHFGFIGFENEEEAQNAVNFFNNTFINTSRITVKISANLGELEDQNKITDGKTGSNHHDKKKEIIKESVEDILKEHAKDPKFIEFMQSHSTDKKIWDGDVAFQELLEKPPKEKVQTVKEHVEEIQPSNKKTEDSKMIELYTVKLMNIPYKTKRGDILKFFRPIKPHSVRIPGHGFCFAGFKTETEFKKALTKDRSFLKKNQIQIIDYVERNKMDIEKTKKQNEIVSKPNSRWAKQEESLKEEESIEESGRIYFRNLHYSTTEEELQSVFDKYGPVAEISLPVDTDTKNIKGFGTVTFVMPEHAIVAFNELNGTSFHGRMLHLMPGKSRKQTEENLDNLNPKQRKLLKQKQNASNSYNWNSLFLGANAVAEILSTNYNVSKSDILDTSSGGSSAAVRLALGETEIVIKMKKYLEENGVCLDVFDQAPKKLSKNIIIAKNLPAGTTYDDIRKLFSSFGLIRKIVLPPGGVTSIIDFVEIAEAKLAYKKLAYTKFKHIPLYLEWAPENTLTSQSSEGDYIEKVELEKEETDDKISNVVEDEIVKTMETEELDNTEPEEDTTIFLRNLNFLTLTPTIENHFKALGQIHKVEIAQKKDAKSESGKTSMGYGFIQFKKRVSADNALKNMKFTTIDGSKVELKRSDKVLKTSVQTNRKDTKEKKQTGTKILVRNIPFQAKENEIRDLFKTFGEIRAVRLPLKLSEANAHRGFGFVDFFTNSDAKNAFEALCQSTHLYGRRLVLEWAKSEESVDDLRKRTADQFLNEPRAKKGRGVFESSSIVMEED